MSDLISKQRAIEAIDRFIPADPMMSEYAYGISVGLAIATRCIEEFSQENHDSSQGLVKQETKRQATIPSDCISRRDAIKSMANAIWHYPNELYTGLNSYEMSEALAKDGLMFLPSAEPEIIRCKECKHFEYDHFENVNGIPLIVAHEICMRWSEGTKTSESGYCFLAERKEE